MKGIIFTGIICLAILTTGTLTAQTEPLSEKQTIYHWNITEKIIAESDSNTGVQTKYIYLGNQKIAMIKKEGGEEKIYYFVNNQQGTPVLILDAQGKIIQRIQTDEYGNIERLAGKFPNEVNFTGKKLDRESGLYYFKGRYYDPVTGRFMTKDPVSQTLNPYLFAGNNPLVFSDPDGEFFQFITPILIGAGISAGTNIGFQLATEGSVSWESVARSAVFGGMSAGMAYGIGEIGQATGLGGNLGFKTVAHGVYGGVQSTLAGGNFVGGFAGGAIGNVAAHYQGNTLLRRVAFGGLASGATSVIAGQDFWSGFQVGAYNQIFNWGWHEVRRAADYYTINRLSTEAFKNEKIDPMAHEKAAWKYGRYIGDADVAAGARIISEVFFQFPMYSAQSLLYSTLTFGMYKGPYQPYSINGPGGIADSIEDVRNTVKGANNHPL